MNKRFSSNFAVRTLTLLVILVSSSLAATFVGGAVVGGEKFDLFKAPTVPGEIRLAGTDGKPMSLSDFKGKVVILNFWRKDCPYCVLEKDKLTDFARKFGGSDLEIISVDLWDDPVWVKEQAAKSGPQFRVATGLPGRKSFVENVVRGRLMGYYVINESNEAIFEIKGFPSTYVIDKRGKVVAGHTGMVNWMAPTVHDTMHLFLKAESGHELKTSDAGSSPFWLSDLMKPSEEIN